MAVVNMVQSPIAVHNLHGPDKNSGRRHQAIRMFLDKAKGGVGGFNELNSGDRAYIKAEAAKRGLTVSIYGYNGAVWDPTVHRVGKLRVKKIMQGGYVGADGVATKKKGDDDRRVGPSRFCLYFPVYTIAVDLEWEFDVTHLMAKWTSTAIWRRPLALRSIKSLEDGIIEEHGVLVGDVNSTGYIDLPGRAEVQTPVPPDMGKRRYTQAMRWGDRIHIAPFKELGTPSDHDLLYSKATFYRHPQEVLKAGKPAPSPAKTTKLPRPGDSKVNWRKHGAPVAHPWADRSARWKRRHPKAWKKIVKWQAAYRRRL